MMTSSARRTNAGVTVWRRSAHVTGPMEAVVIRLMSSDSTFSPTRVATRAGEQIRRTRDQLQLIVQCAHRTVGKRDEGVRYERSQVGIVGDRRGIDAQDELLATGWERRAERFARRSYDALAIVDLDDLPVSVDFCFDGYAEHEQVIAVYRFHVDAHAAAESDRADAESPELYEIHVRAPAAFAERH